MPASFISVLHDHENLFKMLPALVDEVHVHIEPAILVIYYIVLYHGCCLPPSDILTGLPDPDSFCYMESTYLLALRTLPSWQRGATGSLLDLTAASMMVNSTIRVQSFGETDSILDSCRCRVP